MKVIARAKKDREITHWFGSPLWKFRFGDRLGKSPAAVVHGSFACGVSHGRVQVKG